MILPKITKLPSISTLGKTASQLSTEIFGSTSAFRELDKYFDINPFTEISKINGLKELTNIPEVQKLVGLGQEQITKTLTEIKTVIKDKISLDWLNN